MKKLILISDSALFSNFAKSTFTKMKELGLSVCTHWMTGYSIRMFAEMSDYVTVEELKQLDKEALERAQKADKREAKFFEKYGTDKSKRSDDVWDDYEYVIRFSNYFAM